MSSLVFSEPQMGGNTL